MIIKEIQKEKIKVEKSNCELNTLLTLFGKKWSIYIFMQICKNPSSFNLIKKDAHQHISPILISRRLKKMTDMGLIKRYSVKGKINYCLTEPGEDLKSIFSDFRKFANKHDFQIPPSCRILG
jgi:DNA-binding HxlR family transcriptional regulator